MSQSASAAESAQTLLRELGNRAGQVRDRWWIPLSAGLVSVALGLAVMAAGWDVGSLSVVAGVLFIVRGAALVLNPAYANRTSGEHVLAGVAGALAGLVLLAWPGPTTLVLVLFAGVWLAVSGGFQVVVSVARRRELPSWGFTLALGVAELLLGLWAMAGSGTTLVPASTVIGVWAVVTGVIYCLLAFETRGLPAEPQPRPARKHSQG
ncbi:MAG TPA: DUF308 domain-containing protein [Streptosporangiaceae bacterium]|nr:DUF308 domain-containing protein [Streptosporangiaceae bacterium]